MKEEKHFNVCCHFPSILWWFELLREVKIAPDTDIPENWGGNDKIWTIICSDPLKDSVFISLQLTNSLDSSIHIILRKIGVYEAGFTQKTQKIHRTPKFIVSFSSCQSSIAMSFFSEAIGLEINEMNEFKWNWLFILNAFISLKLRPKWSANSMTQFHLWIL
jgi:hypothetical protein